MLNSSKLLSIHAGFNLFSRFIRFLVQDALLTSLDRSCQAQRSWPRHHLQKTQHQLPASRGLAFFKTCLDSRKTSLLRLYSVHKSLHHSTQQKHDLVSTITPAFDWTLQLNAWQAVSVEAKAASHSASESRKMERRVDVKVERSCTANCHWMDLLQALMVLL